ncbi:MAG TPA: DNA double-strand break repair nuclease NurA [Syntrophomonadaceae bacterium]|nr:DNA double-strand break repair nuclease NurA [Syntrophomonadaceae bacterium]
MLHGDELVSELIELNRYLEKRHRVGGTIRERRQRADQKGVFALLSELSGKEISSFFQGRPLVGVDGSLAAYGANYPYVVTFFRALAHTTSSGSNERIWAQEIFSPLLPRYQEKMEERINKGQGPDEAMAHLRWETLATLEAKVALQALELEPRLMVLDGGFARLKMHAPEIWNGLKDTALQQEVLLLGVTEEIATCSLAQTLFVEGEQGLPGLMGDREILFGLLQPGETYRLHEGDSGEQGRLYARFARHPQVVAVDYLKDQENIFEPALNFLYSITPSHGRGFPLWLDVVDAEVRLSKEEVDAMIATYLDPAMAEVFLRPLRASREL